MPGLGFAQSAVRCGLGEISLHDTPELVPAPDDDSKNQFSRHFVGRAGPVSVDVIVSGRRGRWMSATLSIDSDTRLWQYLVSVGPDKTLQPHCCYHSSP